MCEFLGSTNTLISGKALSMMSSKEIVYKKDGLDIYEEPQQDKYYVITSDTSRGIGGDFSAFIVVDITEMCHLGWLESSEIIKSLHFYTQILYAKCCEGLQ